MGFAVFKNPPSSIEVRVFLGHAISASKSNPRHLISDKGTQFWNRGFKQWAKRKKINLRYGAVAKYGSIAIVERFIRSMKTEYTRQIMVPLRLSDMRYELRLYLKWYNEFRPHQSLDGRTPQEVFAGLPSLQPHYETRGKKGIKLKLSMDYFMGRQYLPIVNLQKAA